MQKINLLQEGIMTIDELQSFRNYLQEWVNNKKIIGLRFSDDNSRIATYPQGRGMITVNDPPSSDSLYMISHFTDGFTIEMKIPEKSVGTTDCTITMIDDNLTVENVKLAITYIQCFVKGQVFQPEYIDLFTSQSSIDDALDEIDKFLIEDANPIKMLRKSSV